MFKQLSDKLFSTLQNIKNRGIITEKKIEDTLREVRIAFLEADVALPVVKKIIKNVKDSILLKKINKNLTPRQQFIKIVKKELIRIMSDENNNIHLSSQPPSVILIIGMQGVGKTTSIAKLGKYFLKKKKKVLVVSSDVYRPAAIKQLEILSDSVNIDFFCSHISEKTIDIVVKALNKAKLKYYDLLLVDTAGCLNLNTKMILEIKKIHNIIKPIETLFVIDALSGKNATNIALNFNNILPITGFILTKVDSDARGGSALSIRYITKKPIKFIGFGEKLDALEKFDPEKLANRILGMGDMLSLIEDIENKINFEKNKNLAYKIKNGGKFNFNDFLEQIKQIKSMGGIFGILNKLPKFLQLQHNIIPQDDNILLRMEAMINSMTNKERINPKIITESRKNRIAIGSGMQIKDVNFLLDQFKNIQNIFHKIKDLNNSNIFKKIKEIIFDK